MTDSDVLDAIPQVGAERAAGVWAFQAKQNPVTGAARAVLEFMVWLSEQPQDVRSGILLDIGRGIGRLKAERAAFKKGVK